jgi:hypothetical protein
MVPADMVLASCKKLSDHENSTVYGRLREGEALRSGLMLPLLLRQAAQSCCCHAIRAPLHSRSLVFAVLSTSAVPNPMIDKGHANERSRSLLVLSSSSADVPCSVSRPQRSAEEGASKRIKRLQPMADSAHSTPAFGRGCVPVFGCSLFQVIVGPFWQ